MNELLARFLVGGLVVALVPLVASRLGDGVAGVLLLFPAVTLVGLASLGLARGPEAVVLATVGSLLALPTVVVFLLVVHLASRLGVGVGWSLLVGLGSWIAAASALLALRR